MNFGNLIALFLNEIENVRKENKNNPSLRYIIIAYKNVIKIISDTYLDSETVTQRKVDDLEITDNMKNKLDKLSEIKMTTQIKSILKEYTLKKELSNLLGIGEAKIKELINNGLSSIKQIRQKKFFNQLNLDTQIILEHKPIREIPWNQIHNIETKLTMFNKSITIVGSFRRKKPSSRDIDILFLRSRSCDTKNYITYLKKIFGNRIWIYANGDEKISMILQPQVNGPKYKTDVFITNRDNYYSMLLYTTGSKFHNIKMRARAKTMGLLLNQNGVFDSNNHRINANGDNEKKIFALLNMSYVIPEQRF
jgi:DNA polymerase/3'-5' exonuclease PolX